MMLLKIRICPSKVSVSCSVITLQRFVLASHIVSRIPAICRRSFSLLLTFFTVRIKSCNPIIARSCGLTAIITSSAAVSALIVNVPSDGQVSTIISLSAAPEYRSASSLNPSPSAAYCPLPKASWMME